MIVAIISFFVLFMGGIVLFSMSRIDKHNLLLPQDLTDIDYGDLCEMQRDTASRLKYLYLHAPWESSTIHLQESYDCIEHELKRRERNAGQSLSGSGYAGLSNHIGDLIKTVAKLKKGIT